MNEKAFLKTIDEFLSDDRTPIIVKFMFIDMKERHNCYYGHYNGKKKDIIKYIGVVTKSEALKLYTYRNKLNSIS